MINLYADDTAILATFKNHKTVTLALNKHLALLENYFNKWKIKINVEKTVAVLFTKRIKPVKPPTLYSTPLQWSQSTKYLGLILDKNLTWKHHILHARDKFRHALRLIYPLICRNSDMEMYNKVLLYTAVLRPIISYGCPVWGYAANQPRGYSQYTTDQSQCLLSTTSSQQTSTGFPPQTSHVNPPSYVLPPLHLLRHSSQPIRSLLASHHGFTTSPGNTHYSCYGTEERFAFHVPINLTQSYTVTLYVNDIPQTDSSHLAMFADDTAIISQNKRFSVVISNLQHYISSLELWLNDWKIKVNASKSACLMFTRRSRLPVGLTPVTIFGQPVPWVNVARYLGLFLDAKLTFAYHIEQTRKKALAVHAMLKGLSQKEQTCDPAQSFALQIHHPTGHVLRITNFWIRRHVSS
ncbi:RNA-directed DNA polymerase from mobile element jockey [Trichonephila clavipes]|nr:RNA-directed DNA polymerase from mobile element jockey [Trichonephila clavipes]